MVRFLLFDHFRRFNFSNSICRESRQPVFSTFISRIEFSFDQNFEQFSDDFVGEVLRRSMYCFFDQWTRCVFNRNFRLRNEFKRSFRFIFKSKKRVSNQSAFFFIFHKGCKRIVAQCQTVRGINRLNGRGHCLNSTKLSKNIHFFFNFFNSIP